MDDALLRSLIPEVIGVLVRRGADFAAAEDAVQEALIEAIRVWPQDPPRDAKGWLVTVAWRRFLDRGAPSPAGCGARRSCSRASRSPNPLPAPTIPCSCTSCAPTPR